jgi:hypothetical protein
MDILVIAFGRSGRHYIIQRRFYIGNDIRVIIEKIMKMLAGELPGAGSKEYDSCFTHGECPGKVQLNKSLEYWIIKTVKLKEKTSVVIPAKAGI